MNALAVDLERLAAIQLPLESPVAPLPFEHSLELDHVEFTYEGADRAALRDVCLAIRRGESIGVVGPTGSGKTTLVDVLTGLLAPTSGRILVDGRPLPAAPRAWQRAIGYVPQSVVLVDDSLRRNVALGGTRDRRGDIRARQPHRGRRSSARSRGCAARARSSSSHTV